MCCTISMPTGDEVKAYKEDLTTISSQKSDNEFNNAKDLLIGNMIKLNEMLYEEKGKTSYDYETAFCGLQDEISKCKNSQDLLKIAFKIPMMFAKALKDCSDDCKKAYDDLLIALVKLLRTTLPDVKDNTIYEEYDDEYMDKHSYLVSLKECLEKGTNNGLHTTINSQFRTLLKAVGDGALGNKEQFGQHKIYSGLVKGLCWKINSYFSGNKSENTNVDINVNVKDIAFLDTFTSLLQSNNEFCEKIKNIFSQMVNKSNGNSIEDRAKYLKAMNDMFCLLDEVKKQVPARREDDKKETEDKGKKFKFLSMLDFLKKSK